MGKKKDTSTNRKVSYLDLNEVKFLFTTKNVIGLIIFSIAVIRSYVKIESLDEGSVDDKQRIEYLEKRMNENTIRYNEEIKEIREVQGKINGQVEILLKYNEE